MNFIEVLTTEIRNYEDLIEQVPFNDYQPQKNFLNIYRLNYKELYKHINGTSFPIDANKLLKLTITLGNLIKSLQLDEEMYDQQHQQQQAFNSKLGVDNTKSRNVSGASNGNPFESPKHYINSTPISNQPSYQIKFIKNLLLILKNFDIGFVNKEMNQSSTTLNQSLSSPIKLNSKQLLIEKLEININLDTLFIYKTLITLLIRIFLILKGHIEYNQELGIMNQDTSTGGGNSNRNSFEQSSIFSTTSANSNSSDSISTDEYFKLLNQILNRISNGLIEPLLKYLMEFVGANVMNEFKALITSL